MTLLARLSMAQRIVIVIAFGVSFMLLGYWIALHDVSSFGWVAYAPLSRAASGPFRHQGLTFGWVILIWVGLTIVWAALSVIVLREAKAQRSEPDVPI